MLRNSRQANGGSNHKVVGVTQVWDGVCRRSLILQIDQRFQGSTPQLPVAYQGPNTVRCSGAKDATFVAREFEPTFELVDLLNLPNYAVCLKLMIDGGPSKPFSATTLSP